MNETGIVITAKRPNVMNGKTFRHQTGCGKIYITVNADETGKPFEVFAAIGKAGGCAACQTESIGRMASLALRSGVVLELVAKELQGISCPNPAWENEQQITSCADAIARALRSSVEGEP